MLIMAALTQFGLHAIADPDAVVGVSIAAITLGILFVSALSAGFVVLVRRGRAARLTPDPGELFRRANIALVRLDDAVAADADELSFAVAQFGEPRAAGFAAAVEAARADLANAFALKHQLDGAMPNTPAQVREFNASIIRTCESATTRLSAERSAFDSLRRLERNAAHDLAAARELIDRSRSRLPDAVVLTESLRARFAPSALGQTADNATEATRLLETAERGAADVAGHLDEAGVSAVSASITDIERAARHAAQLLDEIERQASALQAAGARLDETATGARRAVAAAKHVRDDPPDPQSGAAILAAVAAVERSVADAVSSGRADPDVAISRLDAALAELDTALASARNQQQRLSNAKQALEGALFTARSQIEATSAYLSARRGGADARRRLDEAERLLAIAEAESDPVVALDTARSSATHSRDADALARYDQSN